MNLISMMRRKLNRIALPALVLSTTLVALAGGCAERQPGGNAIQVTSRPAPPEAAAPVPAEGENRVTIVVDIDETISVTDYAGFFGLRENGSRPYERANDVLTELSRDFRILYLTARPQWLFSETRTWLTRYGFPPGPVLTTSRVVEVFWPGAFKTRSLALLRGNSPEILIGIGDRSTDAHAYAANRMLTLIVNPRPGVAYGQAAVVLNDWAAVGDFFRQHRSVLREPATLADRFAAGGPSPDPTTIHSRVDVDLSLLYELPLAAPALLLEPLVKFEAIAEQAEAQRALERVQVTFAQALDRVIGEYGDSSLLKLRLGMEGGEPVYTAWVARDGKVLKARIHGVSGHADPLKKSSDAMSGSLAARAAALLTFHEAIDRAFQEIEGDLYELELEMDDDQPTYELALVSLGAFVEVEVHAATGQILEVESETAAP